MRIKMVQGMLLQGNVRIPFEPTLWNLNFHITGEIHKKYKITTIYGKNLF